MILTKDRLKNIIKNIYYTGIDQERHESDAFDTFLPAWLDELEKYNEIIICAAIKDDYNRVFRGHHHHDCIRTLRNAPSGVERHFTEGFITSTNRFVERREAMDIQINAGKMPESDRGVDLFSEDLY